MVWTEWSDIVDKIWFDWIVCSGPWCSCDLPNTLWSANPLCACCVHELVGQKKCSFCCMCAPSCSRNDELLFMKVMSGWTLMVMLAVSFVFAILKSKLIAVEWTHSCFLAGFYTRSWSTFLLRYSHQLPLQAAVATGVILGMLAWSSTADAIWNRLNQGKQFQDVIQRKQGSKTI